MNFHVTNALIGTLEGSTIAMAANITACDRAPIFKLCRLLIFAGHDPQIPLHLYRDGELAITVRSIGIGARLTVCDDNRGTPRLRKWHAPGVVTGRPVKQNGSEAPGHRAAEEQHEPSHFGDCPHCGCNSGFFNIGRSHWFYCDQHQTKWCIGANLFSCWRDETEEDWRLNEYRFGRYRVVEPLFRDPRAGS